MTTERSAQESAVVAAAIGAVVAHAKATCGHEHPDVGPWCCQYHVGMRDGVTVVALALSGELDSQEAADRG